MSIRKIQSEYGAYFAKQIQTMRSLLRMSVLMLITAVFPALGHCDSGLQSLRHIFGSNMNDVAVKVAELPEQFAEVIVRGLDFSPDGSHVAVESDGEKIKVWDWRNGRIEKTVEKPEGFNSGMATNEIQYSPDGNWLVACGSGVGDVVVRVWNTITWAIAKDVVTGSGTESRGSSTAMSFSPDGHVFARVAFTTGSSSNNLVIYSLNTWQPVWGLQLQRFAPVSMSISPDGENAAVAGTLTVVPEDVKDITQRLQQTKQKPAIYIVSMQERKVVRVIPSETAGPVAWSPDGVRIAIAEESVEIFDVKSGARLVHDSGTGAAHMNIRFTPNGRYFIESDMNGRGTGLGVKIWNSNRTKLLQEISGNIGSIGISRDSKYLAVGGTGNTTIWQIK